MSAPKFNFVAERLLGEKVEGDGAWNISILGSKASPTIYFPKDMVSALEMDGKYFKFFADIEKKAIGWAEVKEGLSDLNEARQAKSYNNLGSISFGIDKLLKRLSYSMEGTIKGLRVQKYTHPLLAQKEISYVILPAIERPHTPKKEATDPDSAKKEA